MKVAELTARVLAVVAVGSGSCLSAQTREDPIIKWNRDAKSAVLEREELEKLGKQFPGWKIKQITCGNRHGKQPRGS
jgi:hypothetical protein